MQGMSERQYAADVGLSRGAIQKATGKLRLLIFTETRVGSRQTSGGLPPEGVPEPKALKLRKRPIAPINANSR